MKELLRNVELVYIYILPCTSEVVGSSPTGDSTMEAVAQLVRVPTKLDKFIQFMRIAPSPSFEETIYAMLDLFTFIEN